MDHCETMKQNYIFKLLVRVSYVKHIPNVRQFYIIHGENFILKIIIILVEAANYHDNYKFKCYSYFFKNNNAI